MIDVELPSTFGGILLAALVIFVLISALITTGLLPALIALAAGAVVVYVVYVVVMRIHRLWMRGSIFSRGGGGE